MPDPDEDPSVLAAALAQARSGARDAEGGLFPLVYTQLRRIAGSYFRGNALAHTLQPTALVHEAFLRLVRQQPDSWQDRNHFIAVAAVAMRQILIEHARRKHAAKRGGGATPISLVELPLGTAAESTDAVDILALDLALQRLEALAPRQARVIELQYFGGLTVEEVATLLGVSKGLVEKEWRRARAFLKSALSEDTSGTS